MSNINVAKFGAVVAVLAASLLAFGGSALAATFDLGPTTLRVGSSGMYVKNLQMNLSACGQAASSDGSFGPMTRAAVVAFQTGKTTADGIVGPATKALLASCGGSSTGGSSTVSGCLPGYAFSSTTGASCSGGSSSNDSLSGGAGSIASVTDMSQYSAEDIGEGEEDIVILGREVEADDNSDLALTSVRVKFDATGTTGSKTLSKYVDEVSVWFDGEEVGRADVSDFSKTSTGVYSKTITIDNSVVEAGNTSELTVAVSAVNSIDSSDISSDSWDVNIESVRYTDASGAILTDSSTGDLEAVETIDFVSFASSASTELKITKSSDSPKAGIVIGSSTGVKENITLLEGKLKLDGTSDILLDEFPVNFTPATSTFQSMVDKLYLVIDGEEYSESVPTIAAGASASVTFDDLDFTLEGGDSVNFAVKIDLADTDDFTAGSTITASVSSDNRSHIYAENEEGDNLADSEKSGTAVGEAQTFRANGIAVELVSTDSDVVTGTSANDDAVSFNIKFKVTALGDDAYIGTASSKYTYAVDQAGTATTGGVTAVVSNLGGGGNSVSTTTGGNWQIYEDTSVTVELTVNRAASQSAPYAGLYKAALTAIGWDTSDADAALANSYTSNMDDFKTSYVSVN